MGEPRSAIPRALSIAGSDSGGGAGIQADLKTCSALGGYGMTAITAVTVQNTMGVSAVSEISADIVRDQVTSVLGDLGADAVKTGMLASARIISAVAGALEGFRELPLVIDPVFVSKHGDPLLQANAIGALKAELLPLAELVTPNTHEASGLAGFEVVTRDDMRRAAEAILALGARAVLVKGGHLAGDSAADLLADGESETWLEQERIDTVHTHGTGCTLSAAIAAYRAKGLNLAEAVAGGKLFVTGAIRGGLAIGQGIGPVDQLWELRKD